MVHGDRSSLLVTIVVGAARGDDHDGCWLVRRTSHDRHLGGRRAGDAKQSLPLSGARTE